MTEYQRYPHAVVLHKVQWMSRGNNSLLWTWKLIKHYKKANYKILHYEALNRNILYQTIKRKSTHLKASFKNHINSIEHYQKANCNVLHFKASLEKWPSLPRRFERYCLSSVAIRAGPQSKKWPDQQITLNPTGSIHKKARKKKFDPKKVDFDEGDCTWKKWPVLMGKWGKNIKKNAFWGPILVLKVSFWGF